MLVDDLKRIRNLLKDPKRWTQKSFAKDERGGWVLPQDPKAVSWCLRGALRKEIVDFEDRLITSRHLQDLAGGEGLVNFNDTHSHREVMSLLDLAIRTASKRKSLLVRMWGVLCSK